MKYYAVLLPKGPNHIPSAESEEVHPSLRICLHVPLSFPFAFPSCTGHRYPEDPFDRIWPPDSEVFPNLGAITISAPANQLVDNVANISSAIPHAVLATAASGRQLTYSRVIPPYVNIDTFVYYAELNATITPTDRYLSNH